MFKMFQLHGAWYYILEIVLKQHKFVYHTLMLNLENGGGKEMEIGLRGLRFKEVGKCSPLYISLQEPLTIVPSFPFDAIFKRPPFPTINIPSA